LVVSEAAAPVRPPRPRIVIVATGGTIAGTAESAAGAPFSAEFERRAESAPPEKRSV